MVPEALSDAEMILHTMICCRGIEPCFIIPLIAQLLVHLSSSNVMLSFAFII